MKQNKKILVSVDSEVHSEYKDALEKRERSERVHKELGAACNKAMKRVVNGENK